MEKDRNSSDLATMRSKFCRELKNKRSTAELCRFIVDFLVSNDVFIEPLDSDDDLEGDMLTAALRYIDLDEEPDMKQVETELYSIIRRYFSMYYE